MKASSEFALYHQAQRDPVRLEILKIHDDGTVDLGRDGVVIVSQCPVIREPQPGCCTPEARPKSPKAPAAPQQQLQQPPEAGQTESASAPAAEPPASDKPASDPDAPVGARPPVK